MEVEIQVPNSIDVVRKYRAPCAQFAYNHLRSSIEWVKNQLQEQNIFIGLVQFQGHTVAFEVGYLKQCVHLAGKWTPDQDPEQMIQEWVCKRFDFENENKNMLEDVKKPLNDVMIKSRVRSKSKEKTKIPRLKPLKRSRSFHKDLDLLHGFGFGTHVDTHIDTQKPYQIADRFKTKTTSKKKLNLLAPPTPIPFQPVSILKKTK
jgi:hypothetical protein